MKHIMTSAPARKSPSHPPAATATVADVMRPPLTTAGQDDHVAAAAYLMKHTATTALMVTDAQTGQLAGIITQADVARAIADGTDPNNIRIHAAMITRPIVTTTTSIRDAATIMTASHLRHLPVAGDAGLLGVIDITDLCHALTGTGQRMTATRPQIRTEQPVPAAMRQTSARPHYALICAVPLDRHLATANVHIGSACVIHGLCCPVGGRPASPRKSQTKSQRRPTSGDTQRRQATVKPGQVPIERH